MPKQKNEFLQIADKLIKNKLKAENMGNILKAIVKENQSETDADYKLQIDQRIPKDKKLEIINEEMLKNEDLICECFIFSTMYNSELRKKLKDKYNEDVLVNNVLVIYSSFLEKLSYYDEASRILESLTGLQSIVKLRITDQNSFSSSQRSENGIDVLKKQNVQNQTGNDESQIETEKPTENNESQKKQNELPKDNQANTTGNNTNQVQQNESTRDNEDKENSQNINANEEIDKNDEDEAENRKKEEVAANLEKEEEEKLQDEKEEAENEEDEEVAANLEKEEEEKLQDEVEENQSKGLFWNIFGAIFSGIGLGGSIATGATIVLGVGALAALSGVGLILAGAAAATVGLVSLGGLIYNLVKIHIKRKLPKEIKEKNNEGKGMKSQEISMRNEVNQNQETDQQQTIIHLSNSENVDENGEPVPLRESVNNLNKGIND